jgi:UDP-3-O-[3-hydroxymyristoyl] glucosamine N-acyltransferase
MIASFAAVERIPLMSFSLAQIAQIAGGKLHGDADLMIRGANILRDAQAGEITFCDRPELVKSLATSAASAVLLAPGLTTDRMASITVEDVPAAFAKIVFHFRPPRTRRSIGISRDAQVSRFAKLADDVEVHAGATIGDDVTIARGCVIYSGVHIMAGTKLDEEVTIFPGAVLYENTVVGPRAIIHSGAVLGAYGFGYDSSTGKHVLSSQLGYVVLEADVEVGACATIDRGTYGATLIGAGTKIDNHVQIAHNCRIGRHNLICSQVGVAGSTTTGDYVVLAGQVGVKDHVHVGDRAMVGATSGVHCDIPAGEVWLGTPATPVKAQRSQVIALTHLPEMRRDLRNLQKQIATLLAERENQQPSRSQRDAA